jgi:hypothetical protein
MTWSKLSRRLDLNLALVALLSVFAFAPLAYPGFFESHSGFLPVFHLYDLEAHLWSNWGWLPHLTASPNLLTGEGAMPYLVAESLRWLALDGVQAIKGVYALGFVVSGLAAYLLGKRLFGAAGGLLAAVVYVYAPFHLATVYVRGAFAEAWAFALYPLVLLCWDLYLRDRRVLWAASGVLAYAALASTSLGLALIYAIFIFSFVLAASVSRAAKGRALLLLVAALGLALVLQVPSVIRYGLPPFSDAGFSEHFLYPFQLLSASWGYGTSVPGWQDTLPLQLGVAATGLTMVAGLLLAGQRRALPQAVRAAGFFVAATAVLVFLLLQPTTALWHVSRLSLTMCYPWQLLSEVAVAMSMASAATIRLEPRLGRLPWQAVLVCMVVLESYGYLAPRYTDVHVGGSPVAVLGDQAMLLSYQREGPLRHGATVRVTLYWQGLRPMETDYTVFVHVVDEQGTIWAQGDSMPAGGERPTSTWSTGEIVEDTHEVTIDVEGPAEGYVLEIGLYDQASGRRLPLAGGGTAITLE